MSSKKHSKPKKHPLQQLTVYLLKSSVKDWPDALQKPDNWDPKAGGKVPTKLELGGGAEGWLYPKLGGGKQPRWMRFLDAGIAPGHVNPYKDYATRSAGGLVLAKIDGRFYALTYGTGRTMLKQSCWEPRFGLQILLNRVTEESFRQAHMRNHDGQTVQRAVSSSRLSRLRTFGFDSEQDMVEKLTAKLPKDDPFGAQVTGSDQVNLSCSIVFADLVGKIREIYAEYAKTDWKTKFPEVLSILPIKDKTLVGALDAEVVTAILAGRTSKIHLCPPDLIVYDERFHGFVFSAYDGLEPCQELTLSEYQNAVGTAVPLTIQMLRSETAKAIDGEDGLVGGPWSLYDCIIAEINYKGATYVLTRGEWFQFNKDYIAALDKSIDAIPASKLFAAYLPQKGESEDAFNKRLGDDSTTPFELGHVQMVIHGGTTVFGGQSKIEVCDLMKLGPKHFLIHLKDSNRGVDMGHLFNQGLVSFDLIMEDGEFRAKAAAELPKCAPALPKIKPNGSDYAVVYGIMSKSTGTISGTLTLFSKVVLKRMIKEFGRRSVDVYCDLLPV